MDVKPERMRRRLLLVALACAALMQPVRAEVADHLGVMAGESIGLVQVALGSQEHPASLSLAFVGEPVVVDGATVDRPVVRLGVVDRDGIETYETRVLEASAFARLGSSWYLDLEIPDLGTVTIKLTEGAAAESPVRAASVVSTGRDQGETIEAVGHRHKALLAGASWSATVSVLFRGFELDLERARATLGEAGTVLTSPADLCAGPGTERTCLS